MYRWSNCKIIEIDFFRNRLNFDDRIVWRSSNRIFSIISNSYFLHLWRQQNWTLYYATIKLRMIYLFESRNLWYYYYWILKYQLHATYNWRIVLVNTLYFLLSISNIRNLLTSQYLSQQHFCSFTSKTSDILLYWLLEFSLRIVRKSDYEQLLLLSRIISETTQFWSDSIKAHFLVFTSDLDIRTNVSTNSESSQFSMFDLSTSFMIQN